MFNRWKEKAIPAIERAKASAEYAAFANEWAKSKGVAFQTWNQNDRDRIDLLLKRTNLMEQYLSNVVLQKWGVQFRNGDIDITAPAGEKNEGLTWQGLGAVIIPVLVIAGVVVLSSATVWVTKMITDSQKSETEDRKKVRELDFEIVKNHPDKTAAWTEFKKQNEKLQKKAGISFGGALGGGLGIGLIALGAIAFLSMRRK